MENKQVQQVCKYFCMAKLNLGCSKKLNFWDAKELKKTDGKCLLESWLTKFLSILPSCESSWTLQMFAY